MRIVKPNFESIRTQWNEIAQLRGDQIHKGFDLTYNNFIIPNFLTMVESDIETGSRVLDYGCGTGAISKYLPRDVSYLGVDISKSFIDYAKSISGDYGDFLLLDEDESFPKGFEQHFDAVFSIMTIMDVINLDQYMLNASSAMISGGRFYFVMTHPCFWPVYWGYSQKEWYSYKEELAIEGEFKTSTAGNLSFKTVHFHRPLERILSSMEAVGLRMISLHEPTSEGAGGVSVPATMPRYLFGKAGFL